MKAVDFSDWRDRSNLTGSCLLRCHLIPSGAVFLDRSPYLLVAVMPLHSTNSSLLSKRAFDLDSASLNSFSNSAAFQSDLAAVFDSC